MIRRTEQVTDLPFAATNHRHHVTPQAMLVASISIQLNNRLGKCALPSNVERQCENVVAWPPKKIERRTTFIGSLLSAAIGQTRKQELNELPQTRRNWSKVQVERNRTNKKKKVQTHKEQPPCGRPATNKQKKSLPIKTFWRSRVTDFKFSFLWLSTST